MFCERMSTIMSGKRKFPFDGGINDILTKYPKTRRPLPAEYEKVIDRAYLDNRKGATPMSKASSFMEGWGHRKVAATQRFLRDDGTLEIGAGTLNQFDYEKKSGRYDIVEPSTLFLENSQRINMVDKVYNDIADIPDEERYDRITSCYTFEHILNLPFVIASAGLHLTKNGVLAISIPNEGGFLWKMGWKYTTGREFKKKYNLDYGIFMRNEHVNTANEIEILLRYFFDTVKMSMFGVSRNLAFYRYFLCHNADTGKCRRIMTEMKQRS